MALHALSRRLAFLALGNGPSNPTLMLADLWPREAEAAMASRVDAFAEAFRALRNTAGRHPDTVNRDDGGLAGLAAWSLAGYGLLQRLEQAAVKAGRRLDETVAWRTIPFIRSDEVAPAGYVAAAQRRWREAVAAWPECLDAMDDEERAMLRDSGIDAALSAVRARQAMDAARGDAGWAGVALPDGSVPRRGARARA